jgi:hypothetical protein
VTVEGVARKFVAAVVIGLSIAWLVWAIGGLNFSDADAYRLAADRLVAGQDIYVQPPNQDEAYRYAPWFAIAWIPLAALPQQVGNLVWAAILSVATLFCVLPLARQDYLAARLLAVFGGSMLIWTVARGNVHPLVMVALIQGLDRRLGPLWLALAASLKAVPICFVLVYVARREWWRAAAAMGITTVLVLPMPILGWEPGTVDPGESLSLYFLVSPGAWAISAVVAAGVALFLALNRSKYVALASATAAILALPRLLLYDITYVMVGADKDAVSPDRDRATTTAS